MDRPKITFRKVDGKAHVPPPNRATIARRRKAEEAAAAAPPPPPAPPPTKPDKPAKPRKPLDAYRNSDSADVPGVNATARELVRLMVWEGKKRRELPALLGISEGYAYRLLRSPDVLAFYNAELDVLRTSGKARLVHRLEELTEQDDNQTAAVNAAKVLLTLDGSGKGGGTTVNVGVAISPGWVIDCTEALANPPQPARLSVEQSKDVIEQTVGARSIAGAYQIVDGQPVAHPTGHGRPGRADDGSRGEAGRGVAIPCELRGRRVGGKSGPVQTSS